MTFKCLQPLSLAKGWGNVNSQALPFLLHPANRTSVSPWLSSKQSQVLTVGRESIPKPRDPQKGQKGIGEGWVEH